jgi:serine protease Do
MEMFSEIKIRHFFWPGMAVLALVAGAIIFDAPVAENTPSADLWYNTYPSQQPVMDPVTPGSAVTALQVQEGFNLAVSKVRPAVVSVSKSLNSAPAQTDTGTTLLDPYPGKSGPVGSGFIIEPNGYVLTTGQTVGQAKVARVTFFSSGKREYQADVISVDPETDLALLKIRAREIFPTVLLGNSDLIEVGDMVLAVGSPFGFSRTVTMGIISSNKRKINIDGTKFSDLIQTDAAINRGNDGGPLVNIKGEVIGVNMASFVPNNQYSGISFAVPINDALKLLNGMAR